MPTVQAVFDAEKEKKIRLARQMFASGYRFTIVDAQLRLPKVHAIRIESSGTNVSLSFSIERTEIVKWGSGETWQAGKRDIQTDVTYRSADFPTLEPLNERHVVLNVEVKADTAAAWSHDDIVFQIFFERGAHYERIQLLNKSSGTASAANEQLFSAQFSMPNARGWPAF